MRFSMYATIRFNRPIDIDKDYISPGGYTIMSNGREYQFDFEDYEGRVDKDESDLLHIECRHPDAYSFADIANITEDTLAGIKEFTEFFIYIGEPSDLKPVKLESCDFINYDNNDSVIAVSVDACNKTKFAFGS